ncbi:MAG: hypothetical protein IPP49_09420 [Saprospiraceae bacterium]|nr:hypothetical protein [Saprospiraceae bacterium]
MSGVLQDQKQKINTPPTQESKSVLVEKSAPSLSAGLSSIDAIRENIRKAEITKAEARKNIHIDLVKRIWSQYAENNPSKSVQSALNLAIIELSDKTISVRVPTQVSKDMILQESNLLNQLRNDLGVSDLVFDIEIDKSLFPNFEENKPVTIMTQKEKYIHMLEKNPSLGSFTKKFGLKLDTEV